MAANTMVMATITMAMTTKTMAITESITITISLGHMRRNTHLNLVLAQAPMTISIPAQILTVYLALIISPLSLQNHDAQTHMVTSLPACV